MTQTVTAPATAGARHRPGGQATSGAGRPDRRLLPARPGRGQPRRAEDVDAVIDGHLRVGRHIGPPAGEDPGVQPHRARRRVVGDLHRHRHRQRRHARPGRCGGRRADRGRRRRAPGAAPDHRGAPRRRPAGRGDRRRRRGIAAARCVLRESWIHVLIDRLADADQGRGTRRTTSPRALDDVRAIVAGRARVDVVAVDGRP